MKRFLVSLVLWVAFLGCYGASAWIQHLGMTRVLKYAPFYDTWQLGGRSGELMKLFALRYDMVAADFLWLRSIQSFGGRGMTNRDWRPIYNQFETITDLDPYFKDAYIFGNLVIGDEGGHLQPGLDLLNKGTFKVFRQYRPPFEAMYVAHWQMKDEKLARWYGTIASGRPDAPEWIDRMVAYIDVNSGQYYIGLDRFIGNLMQGIDADEPILQGIALNKAAEGIDKWNADTLATAADEFTSQTGRLPRNINELAAMPALQKYETGSMARLLADTIKISEALGKRPLDPATVSNYAAPDPQVLATPISRPTGTSSKSIMADYQDIVFQDTLTTVSGIPPSPTDSPYAINLARLPFRQKYKPEEIFVPTIKLNEAAAELLQQIRQGIAARKKELGRNPKSLDEVFYTPFQTPEPFGGSWIYDPENGSVRMSTHPTL
jgi:hypothetical protein